MAVLIASLLGYALAAAGLAPVEAMRRRAGEISLAGDDERLPLPAARRRGPPARRDAQRDARAPAARVRARAAVRRRRQPRAAHAGRGHQDRARGRAARRRARPAGARGAGRRGRGVRPPRPARRGPARRRARRRERAARAAGATARSTRCSTACASASPTAPASGAARSASTPPRDSTAGGATRCGCARRSATSSTTRCATATGDDRAARAARECDGVALEVARRRAGLRRRLRRARVRALRPRRRRARRATAPGSAWRSCGRSPRPTAAGPSSCPAAGATVRIWLPETASGRSQRAGVASLIARAESPQESVT